MMNDNSVGTTSWAIFELIFPRADRQILAVASSPLRAAQLGLKEGDNLLPGEMLIVANHTAEWLERSQASAKATWAILTAHVESLLRYDDEGRHLGALGHK